MTIKEITKKWREYSRYVPRTYSKPSSVLKAASVSPYIRYGMCKAISSVSSCDVLVFFRSTGLLTRAAYIRYHWTCLEVWIKWWDSEAYWDNDSDEAAERRIAFIKHLIKKLEKHGL